MKALDDRTFDVQRPNMRVTVHLSGIGAENARKSCEYLADQVFRGTVNVLISTGFACGLKPEIKPGDITVDFGRSDISIAEKLDRISARLGTGFHKGVFWCANRPLMSAKDKHAISQKSGAIAGEMESQSVYEFCKNRKISFGSFRAVSDALDQNLPSAALRLSPDGSAGFGFWKTVFTNPAEWPDLIRLSRSAHAAEKNLRRALELFLKEIES